MVLNGGIPSSPRVVPWRVGATPGLHWTVSFPLQLRADPRSRLTLEEVV